MDFLLDVNASGAVARWLIDRGHNIAEVGQKDPRMSDDEILSWAVRERRTIVTTDNDFEEMIWRQGKSHCPPRPHYSLPLPTKENAVGQFFWNMKLMVRALT